MSYSTKVMHIYVFRYVFVFYLAKLNLSWELSYRISHVCKTISDLIRLNVFYLQGDDQLIERLAGLDGIITESGNNLKEESGKKNRVRVLAEVSARKFVFLHSLGSAGLSDLL